MVLRRCIHHFYIALFSALEPTQCVGMSFYIHEWLAFYSSFLNIHQSGVLTALTTSLKLKCLIRWYDVLMFYMLHVTLCGLCWNQFIGPPLVRSGASCLHMQSALQTTLCTCCGWNIHSVPPHPFFPLQGFICCCVWFTNMHTHVCHDWGEKVCEKLNA